MRNYQLHLVDQGTSPIKLNATITGLKFFFDVTLDRSDLMAKMKPVFVPRTHDEQPLTTVAGGDANPCVLEFLVRIPLDI